MIQKKLIIKKKADMSAVAISDTTIAGVVNKSATYVKKVIVDEDYECLKDWLSCPNVNLNLVDLHSINAQYPDLLNLLNIDINNIRVYYDTDMEKPTVTRAARITINSDASELCEVSLGNYRNYISKVDGIEKIVMAKRIYYDKTSGLRKDKDNGNTNFATMFYAIGDITECTNKLKDIFKNFPKIAVTWY